jgi:hypothetical protein
VLSYGHLGTKDLALKACNLPGSGICRGNSLIRREPRQNMCFLAADTFAARPRGRVLTFVTTIVPILDMAPKRLRQTTLNSTGLAVGNSRALKTARSASAAASARWLDVLPQGLMVFCPTAWVKSQTPCSGPNAPSFQSQREIGS